MKPQNISDKLTGHPKRDSPIGAEVKINKKRAGKGGIYTSKPFEELTEPAVAIIVDKIYRYPDDIKTKYEILKVVKDRAK